MTVSLFNGPYGPYLKAGKTNIGLPEGTTVEQLTPEIAFTLVNEKLGAAPAKKGKKPAKTGKATKIKKIATPKIGKAMNAKKVVVKKTKKLDERRQKT